jgi:hypothetical protein
MKRTAMIDVPEYQATADELIASGQAEAGTMMGHPCLRRNGAFFATAGHDADELILKLSAERVQELIADGAGEPFAPAGKTFREWVAIPREKAKAWPALIREAHAAAAR